MSAACTVPKEKLYCKFCNTKNSHNTSACIKKQKEEKDRKKGSNTEKQTKKLNPTHPMKGEKLPKDGKEISQT